MELFDCNSAILSKIDIFKNGYYFCRYSVENSCKFFVLKTKKQNFIHTSPHKIEFRVILKHMHPSTRSDDIITAIEELGHTVVNIWHIKQRTTKRLLPILIVKLKIEPNNKASTSKSYYIIE